MFFLPHSLPCMSPKNLKGREHRCNITVACILSAGLTLVNLQDMLVLFFSLAYQNFSFLHAVGACITSNFVKLEPQWYVTSLFSVLIIGTSCARELYIRWVACIWPRRWAHSVTLRTVRGLGWHWYQSVACKLMSGRQGRRQNEIQGRETFWNRCACSPMPRPKFLKWRI